MEHGSFTEIVEECPGSVRLDCYAAQRLNLTRSQIKSRLLEAKRNGKQVKLSCPVKTGDAIELSWLPAAPVYLEPENIQLDLIYEDERCAVINKPQGLVVHPGAGNHSGTLANGILWRRLKGRSVTNQAGFGFRTGIVHRLDKDTSGVIIAAYDDEALASLSAQFKAGTVRKQYLALVQGTPEKKEGRIFTRLVRDPRDRKRFTVVDVEQNGASCFPRESIGKTALTMYRTLKSWGDYSMLLLKPRTGRTHQLRVHLKYLGHPIVGDPIYNQSLPASSVRDNFFSGVSMMLHAFSLAIVLPDQTERRCFKAPLPDRFKTIIAALNKRKK